MASPPTSPPLKERRTKEIKKVVPTTAAGLASSRLPTYRSLAVRQLSYSPSGVDQKVVTPPMSTISAFLTFLPRLRVACDPRWSSRLPTSPPSVQREVLWPRALPFPCPLHWSGAAPRRWPIGSYVPGVHQRRGWRCDPHRREWPAGRLALRSPGPVFAWYPPSVQGWRRRDASHW